MTSGNFGSFNAGYGEEVSVYRSSSASGGVWFRIKQRPSDAVDFEGNPANKPGEAAAHLTPAQAIVLRAALDNYLAEQEDE